jgi:cell division septum initiation protein DivIVA
MAAEPDDDARRTLADLEARLRDLEQELLGGREPDDLSPRPEPDPEPAAAAATPAGAVDPAALADLHAASAALAVTLESLADTSAEIRVHARALRDEQGAMSTRLHGAARAAALAERAAVDAQRIAGGVVIEAEGVTDAAAVLALRDTLAAQPATREAYVRGVEAGRAVIEVHLT